MAPASNGALLNITYYYYYYISVCLVNNMSFSLVNAKLNFMTKTVNA